MGLLFQRVREILHRQFSFHYDQIQPETKFELELGTDSREMLELIYVFESEFNINIDLDDIVDIITVQDSVDYIKKKIRVLD
jgi:acyl carrier protein